jgi:molybdate transport repressor ModE-like protein
MHIEIRPEWLLKKDDGSTISLPILLRLLTGIRESGSISAAAIKCELSYRHAWGLLKEFEERFDASLVQKLRGQGTVLSPLAEKLIWADKRIAARLSPMLDSLASELERELESVLARGAPVLRIRASHGFAVDALIKELAGFGVAVDLRYRGSTEALAALAQNECDLAGFHLPVGEFQAAVAAKYQKWFNPKQHGTIHLAYRTQGLFVAKGNPKGIRTLADLAKPDIRFVNRQNSSGTRLLLELMLKKEKIDGNAIHGFETAEFTHAAVAAYVASGMADVGFGVETAARRFDLDFVPLVRERYFFAYHLMELDKPAMQAALAVMKADAFKEVVSGLPGYDGSEAGSIIDLAA